MEILIFLPFDFMMQTPFELKKLLFLLGNIVLYLCYINIFYIKFNIQYIYENVLEKIASKSFKDNFRDKHGGSNP